MSADFLEMSMMGRFLFPPSTIPLMPLQMRSNIQALESLFSFQSLQASADVNQVRLVGGMGEFEKISIQQLVIDAISITLIVSGDRSALDHVYDALCQFLTRIDSKNRMEDPKRYAMTYQTQSTVRMSFPYERLLSEKLVDFLKASKETMKPEGCDSVGLNLSNLSFQVKFNSPNDTYYFMPKVLTIEPRAGSDPKDNLYFVVTPTDSEEHRRLIEELEKTLN
jgi:hypothetical protein